MNELRDAGPACTTTFKVSTKAGQCSADVHRPKAIDRVLITDDVFQKLDPKMLGPVSTAQQLRRSTCSWIS